MENDYISSINNRMFTILSEIKNFKIINTNTHRIIEVYNPLYFVNEQANSLMYVN